MYSTYHAANLHELSEFLAEAEIEGGGFYLVERSKKVFSHDFERGFVRTTGTIFAPLVLKTVFVFESYLKGRRSSFAILNNCPRRGQGEGAEVGFTQNTKVGPNALVSITIAPYVILRPPVDPIRQHMTSSHW
jgi:hypothetical protein